MKNVADVLRNFGHKVTEASTEDVKNIIEKGGIDLIVVVTDEEEYYGLNPKNHKLLELLFKERAGLVC